MYIYIYIYIYICSAVYKSTSELGTRSNFSIYSCQLGPIGVHCRDIPLHADSEYTHPT